jgi:cysteine desulfuration protein SufE
MAAIEQTINEIADEFALLPDWEERIAHVIELARALEPLEDSERNELTRVRGCASQVWLVPERRPQAPQLLYFRGDSDAHLVRGEIAMLLRIFSGRTPQEILSVDPRGVFERLGLKDALTQQRSNGLFSMMNRIQHEARAALSG